MTDPVYRAPIPVYRAPMRSRRDDVPAGLAVERALDLGCCGFGGRLDPPPADLAEALTATAFTYDARTARRLQRFAEVPVGAFVWTREPDGPYYLGRLKGGWQYDASPAAAAADLVHVRPCDWSRSPIPESAVPGGTVLTFARGGRNFQRTNDAATEVETARLWAGVPNDRQ
ncbi:GAF domain-containing protein [Kribbella sp. CA-293567]|uniref:GAF domain-containing protein n=1 Tax=Kribbella sp. CA-293567 TaxID=3002436 RepID=UPI0022DDEC35|nr:GAF domain-containing protein [Kribbella sp. CA-293567]WBQ05096.1 GAF domain-containing protein [Kribbella sp. CA-293567]